ncbi:MAG TPA: DUF429 domain-containing protein [Acidimicrobiales bacterium]|nr:DUF429 domain-containing protein [Acidimicrobiales bacterium]
MTRRAVGIDVGAETIWAVSFDLDERARPATAWLSHPVDLVGLAERCEGAAVVAVDAPAAPSDRPHLGDERLASKFQAARCGEVALRRRGIAVPWVTPPRGTVPAPWVATGYAVWEALLSQSLTVVETYPHGIFWRLFGAPITHKQHPAGHLRRIAVLREIAPLPEGVEMWSHDGIDALACATLAVLVADGAGERADCTEDGGWPTHDGSSIWLPPAAEKA